VSPLISDFDDAERAAIEGAELPPHALNGCRVVEGVPDHQGKEDQGDGWEEPERFGATHLPAFPVEVLPPWLRDWVSASAEFAQVPVDLPASVALSVASLGSARIFDVEVRSGWSEPTNIWTAVVLRSGERKSPNYVAATKPVIDYGASEAERREPLIRDRARERRVLAEQIEDAETCAAKGKPYQAQDALQAAHELDALLSSKPEIRAPKLLTDDVTAEALARVLAENYECIGLFSSEGGPFEVMGGRYSDGPNIELHLKAHSGDPHMVDRIKREPITLHAPRLTVAVTVQPDVISGLATKPGFRGRGLLARILYSLPPSKLGSRKVDAPGVPTHVTAAYHHAVTGLLRAFDPERPSRRILTLDPGADRARATYAQRLEPRLGPDGDLCSIADWAGKLVGAVCRLAGILHVADHVLDLAHMPETVPSRRSCARRRSATTTLNMLWPRSAPWAQTKRQTSPAVSGRGFADGK
jgi:replicative DNA helicase